MKRLKAFIAAIAITVFTVLPSGSALASHRCGLGHNPVNTICEGYHEPKPLLAYLVCLVLPSC